MIMKTVIMVAAALAFGVNAGAQGIDEILRRVEQNNKELKALGEQGRADALDIEAQNNLENPSVEYSPFFAKGVSGIATSELVVKQGFDFPTLYAARSKSGKLQKEVVNLGYQTSRCNILLSAKQLCLDLILLNQERDLLEKRRKNADELLAMYETRMKNGDATVLEVNKVKMDRMNVQTEVTQNEVAHQTALQSLLALNGNMPLEFDMRQYPSSEAVVDYEALYDRAVASELTLRSARAEVQASAQNVKVNRQNWLPKLEVGYRRNTDGSDASNGFMVGASFPLFSGRNRLKSAKARLQESELQLDNVRVRTENNVRSQVNEMKQLRHAADTYDTALLYSTLDLLRKAVEGGELSLIEYYVEADAIYRNLQTQMQLENKYQKVWAELTKGDL